MEQAIEILLYGNKFRRLYEKLILNVMGEYGLKKIDVEILYFLYCSGNHNTSKDIMNLDMFTKGHISQSVDRMEKLELIKSVQDGNDRRCTHLVLTDNADAIIERILVLRKNIKEVIFKDVTDEEKEFLLMLSKKIENNIDNEL